LWALAAPALEQVASLDLGIPQRQRIGKVSLQKRAHPPICVRPTGSFWALASLALNRVTFLRPSGQAAQQPPQSPPGLDLAFLLLLRIRLRWRTGQMPSQKRPRSVILLRQTAPLASFDPPRSVLRLLPPRLVMGRTIVGSDTGSSSAPGSAQTHRLGRSSATSARAHPWLTKD